MEQENANINISEFFSGSLLRTFGFLFAGISVLFVLGYFLVSRFDFQPLYSGLDIEDAAMISAELDRQELRYRIVDGGRTLLVPKHDIGSVRLALHNADGLGTHLAGFELFNESEMGLTDFAQKIKFQRAIQGELSRTIMMMEGVKSSRVHVALPERSVFRSQSTEPKAAVILIPENGIEFDFGRVLGIQSLVAASIPELSLKNVIILDYQGALLSPFFENDEFTEERDMADGAVDKKAYGELKTVSIDIPSEILNFDKAVSPPVSVDRSSINTPSVQDEHSVPSKDKFWALRATETPRSWAIWSIVALLLVIVLLRMIFRRTRQRLTDRECEKFALELSQALNKSVSEAS